MISFDTRELLNGVHFHCGSCTAGIGLSPTSKEQVQKAMEQFDELGKELQKQKKGTPIK